MAIAADTGAPASAELLPRADDDRSILERQLAEVLREQGGEELLAQVGELRAVVAAARGGDDSVERRRTELLGSVPSHAALALVRACSMHLAMANVADELVRLRRHRAQDNDHSPRPLTEAAELLASADCAPALDIRLVLTAHPTDIARRSVLSKHRVVSAALERLDDPRLSSAERRRLNEQISEALSIWYATNEVRSLRPRVADEVRRLLFFFESVLFDAAADLAREWRDALAVDPAGIAVPPLRFGSWAGGDMDGNPYVTPSTILDTLHAHRLLALELLIERLRPLRREFSQAEGMLAGDERLRESLARDEAELPLTAGDLAARYPHEGREPLRRKLAFVIARLQNSRAELLGEARPELGYRDADGLYDDLEAIRGAVGSRAVMRGRLERLMLQVRIFGFHLATLEVRENAPELQEACRALLPGYRAAHSELERAALLTEACLSEKLPARDRGPVPRAAATFDAVARAVGAYGTRAIDTFIASNTEQPSDLLCALWLARRSGLFAPAHGPGPGHERASALELVPLFERRVSLERATETMGTLYGNLAYQEHLHARGLRQEVMLGYSDAGKEMGYLAGQWTLYRAQEQLARQAAGRGIELRLFHGRGGSTSRGGGPACRSILAQPPGTVGGRIKITEQGEVVSAKFSDARLAVDSLEQTVGAVVRATVEPAQAPEPVWREELARMAKRACEAYQRLIYDDPDLPRVFGQCTPIDVLDELNVGSRPTSRRGRSSLQGLRAIPWVFAWMQARVGLPGWFGAGSGLEAGDLGCQREMYEHWPFFAALIEGLTGALAADDLPIARRYFDLASPPGAAGRLWHTICAERERCQERVLAITGRARLIDGELGSSPREPWRAEWLGALAELQLELLQRVRAGDPEARDALLASVAGVAVGLRTTG